MKIVIYKNPKAKKLNTSFIKYLIDLIKKKIIADFDYNKLGKLDNYLIQITRINNIQDIVNRIIRGIVFDNFMDRYVIRFTDINNIGGYTSAELSKVINDGALNIAGYSIINDTFKHFQENINTYYKMYLLLKG